VLEAGSGKLKPKGLGASLTPKRVPGGYVCTECDPATRATFPTCEALWVDELFEPFMTWVNEDLAPAKALYLYRYGGMTAAKLISGTV
jgi:hypothetical protein